MQEMLPVGISDGGSPQYGGTAHLRSTLEVVMISLTLFAFRAVHVEFHRRTVGSIRRSHSRNHTRGGHAVSPRSDIWVG